MIIRTRKPAAPPQAPRRTVSAPTSCKTCTAVRNALGRAVAFVARKPK